ncbi:hypothetical protein SAMN05216296_0648 [Pseudomonas pohangensis]|uniref:Uncharacterized protein n=1 Tax=Pseudomonas pohangensis TaxID=364197 RepID=A0A1H2ECL6_9PSED|nr:hypothetical protein [Pseudomonas pohangensis]SDT92872.1 hypothetical protein SAMN05216296_0648 [Pseudomonas pohangensis]
MLWTLIAIGIAGLGAAGIAMLLRKLTRNRLPKWIIPAFGGLGMLGYQIYYEYNWFEHQLQRQPAEAVLVASETGEVLWRPWTFFRPMTTAFTVLDKKSLQREEASGQTVVAFNLYRFEKQHIDQVSHQSYLLNCTTAELLPLDPQQKPLLEQIRRIERTETLYLQVCE